MSPASTTVDIQLQTDGAQTINTRTIPAATDTTAGVLTAADKTRLDGIEDGAQVNTVTSVSGKTGAVTLSKNDVSLGNVANIDQSKAITSISRSGLTFTATALDGTTTTFTQKDDNTWTPLKGATTSSAGTAGYAPAPAAGSANRYLRSDGTWAVPPDENTEYDPATQDKAGLMSADDKKKLDGISSGATAGSNVSVSQTQKSGTEIASITVDGTATKIYSPTVTVDSSVTSSGSNAVSGSAVTSYVAGIMTGVSTFQGVVNKPTTISSLTNYKAGWYWTIGTAGTYAGQECEVGDQIYCISDYNTAYKSSDFSVVQANVTEMTATEVDQICTI